MNVTAQQSAAIRAGQVRTVFAPPAHVSRWTLGRPVVLRRLTIDEEGKRTHITVTDAPKPGADREPVVVTLLSFGPVQAVSEVILDQARAAGFRTRADFTAAWTALYPHETALVEIGFELGDLRDRPRLLAARMGGHSGDYTSISALAAQGEPEAVDAKTLSRFSKEAALGDGERVAAEREERFARLRAANTALRDAALAMAVAARNCREERALERLLRQCDNLDAIVADRSATLP